MNQRGGIAGLAIFFLLFGGLVFFVMSTQGHPTEIPLLFGFTLPTLFIGVLFLFLSFLMQFEMVTFIIGLTVIIHYYWALGG